MKNRSGARRIDPQKLDSFTEMARRAASSKKISKGLMAAELADGDLTLAERIYIAKVARAHKGAKTLFTRHCRPDAATLGDLILGSFSDKRAQVLDVLAAAAGKSFTLAELADENPCFAPFHAKPLPSLHDGAIREWRMEPGLLSVVFGGYFDDQPGDDARHMEVRFANPVVDVLLRGIPAKLSERAAHGSFVAMPGYDKDNKPLPAHIQRPFATYRAHGQSCMQGFDQLPWIHDEERSLAGEPLSWKILFGSNGSRPFELSIGFDALEFTFGKAAIQARRDALALAQELDDSALPQPARGVRPRI